jgi:hypothetical protein
MNELLNIAAAYAAQGLEWEAAFWLNEAENYREYP